LHEIVGTFSLCEFSHKQKHDTVAAQAPFLTQPRRLHPDSLSFCFYPCHVNDVRNKECSFWPRSIMFKILASPCAWRQACVESRNKAPIGKQLRQPYRAAAMEMQMRIPAHKHFDAPLPRSPDRLPRALVVPAIHQHGIVAAVSNNPADLWCIEAPKPAVPRRVGNVFEKGMGVAGQQVHIPVKLHSKTGARLLLRRGLV